MIIYTVFFIASFIQAIGGFGAGLFAIPLLTLVNDPRFIIPPFSLTVFIFNLFLISEVHKDIEWQKVKLIVMGSFAGIPSGVFFLKYADQDMIRFLISAFTLILGSIFACGFRPLIKEKKVFFFASGFFSGILSGTAAMGGPPLIFLMMLLGMKKESFRATLLCCFLFNGIYSNTLYFVNGFFDHENLRIFFFGFLPAFFGTISGLKLKSFIPEEKFNKIAAVIVIMIGIIGIVRSMMILCTDFDIPDFGK